MIVASSIRRQIALSCGALAAALLLAGCNDSVPPSSVSGTSTSDTSSRDVCSWLSLEEVASLAGVAPTGTASTGATQGCHWTDNDGLPLVQVTIVGNAAGSPEDYAAGLAADLGDDWIRDQLNPVEGLGDWAFWTPEGRMLQVFRDARTLQIMVSRPAGKAEAVAIAGKLLDRDW